MRRLVLNLEDITQKINNGQSAYSISKELGCTKNAILTYLKKNNLKSQHKCKVNYNNLMKDHKDEIITLYNSGMNGNQIAKKLNFSDGHIMALLRKHNVDIRSKNLYTVDETYFEQIDNEEKAYILGWWYSDGNVCDSKLRLCIQQEDEEIVQQIKDCLKYTGPLYYKPSRISSPKPQVELCINRVKMVQDLIKLGCIPNKSMRLQFPKSTQVPSSLIRHFVRGYFDGDGSISGRIMIVGTLSFCKTLKNIVPCYVTNIYQRYTDRSPEDSSHQLFIGRLSEMYKFYHWIYDDATIWLKRKREQFYTKYQII
jgi:hypothetical protein